MPACASAGSACAQKTLPDYRRRSRRPTGPSSSNRGLWRPESSPTRSKYGSNSRLRRPPRRLASPRSNNRADMGAALKRLPDLAEVLRNASPAAIRPALRCLRSALGLRQDRKSASDHWVHHHLAPKRRHGMAWRGVGRSSGGGIRTHNLDLNRVSRYRLRHPGPCYLGNSDVARSFYDNLTDPASTSAWQFEHSSMHLRTSARSFLMLCAPHRDKPNSLAVGSR